MVAIEHRAKAAFLRRWRRGGRLVLNNYVPTILKLDGWEIVVASMRVVVTTERAKVLSKWLVSLVITHLG